MLATVKKQVNDLLTQNQPHAALKLLRSQPQGERDADVSYLMGVANYRMKAFPAAASCFREVISLDASNALSFYYLGLCFERQGDQKEAAKCFRTTVALDPSMEKAKAKLGASATGRESTSATTAKAMNSELSLPTTAAERATYEAAIRQKKLIDARAERQAAWRGRSLPMKIFAWVFFTAIAVGMAFAFGQSIGIFEVNP